MDANVDDRLLGHWLESRKRHDNARDRLRRSSLPVERFEGWALDLIAEAVSDSDLGTAELRASRPALLEAVAPATVVQFPIEPR